MRRDNRFSMSLHVLLHMAERAQPITSEALSDCMGANPVVVRRTLAGLRDARILRSDKGHGGGWQFARKPEDISLLDVYRALGEPVLFQQHRGDENPGCLVRRTVGKTLEEVFGQADELIKKRFEKVRLSDLSKEFHVLMKRSQERGGKP